MKGNQTRNFSKEHTWPTRRERGNHNTMNKNKDAKCLINSQKAEAGIAVSQPGALSATGLALTRQLFSTGLHRVAMRKTGFLAKDQRVLLSGTGTEKVRPATAGNRHKVTADSQCPFLLGSEAVRPLG